MIRTTFRFTGAGEDFGPRADGLITAHSTQSPYNKLTVADAIVLARWQDRADVAGSYNDLICIDGILECMPPSHASGGINPASASFVPEPWLYDLMSREMVHNPNYFTRNVSFMGDCDWFDANGWPPQMIDNFVTVMLEEEARIGSRTILTDHEDFQLNRHDAGPIANALIRKRYAERTAQEDDMTWVNNVRWYKTPALVTFRPGTSYRLAPDLDDTGVYVSTANEQRTVIGEVDGLDFGVGPLWLVIPGDGGVAKVAHSQDEVSRTAFGATVEVVKEVPTGITQEQLLGAATAERERIALAEANRIRNS